MTNEPHTDDSMPDAPVIRRLMFSIAYRMLGRVADTEDIVQEAFLRLQRAMDEGIAIESPKAYLATVTTRLAIDHLRSAQVRRESYVGSWLPEPLIHEKEPAAVHEVEMAESLSMAFLLVLETLSPIERAVFLLREVFDYGYDEISQIVQKSEDNCRQIFTRAKRHIESGKPRFEASREKRDELAQRFFAACQDGNVDDLVHLLADDAVFYGDGGGKAVTAQQPVHGRDRVVRLLHGVLTKAKDIGGRLRQVDVNGQPGAIFVDKQDRVVGVVELDILNGAVQSIRSVVNPDKLQHLGSVSDVLRRRRVSGM
jgi:RNA polymerase sigma-70 factor (ECF subfamily)